MFGTRNAAIQELNATGYYRHVASMVLVVIWRKGEVVRGSREAEVVAT